MLPEIPATLTVGATAPPASKVRTPPLPVGLIQVEGPLFEDVQRSRVFDDAKTFPDREPLRPPADVMADYLATRTRPDFDLRAFVDAHFGEPQRPADHPLAVAAPGTPIGRRIEEVWQVLRRPPAEPRPGSSLLALPHPYVVPGGRFVELYYWDSDFTAEGLAAGGHHDDVRNLALNFADLIDRYGFVPNGNRAYYLSRSQPPFFAPLLDLIERTHPDRFAAVEPLLPALEAEHAFWTRVEPDGRGRVVRLPDGRLANRHWDDGESPRPESWRDDMKHASPLPEAERPQFFRDVRAACESGWDFSSRWLAGHDLSTIRTTRIVPVDLNALLYFMEARLATWLDRLGRPQARSFARAAEARRQLVQTLLWDEAAGFFVDHDLDRDAPTGVLSLAGVVPLFVGAATPAQAARVADRLTAPDGFLRAGGLVSTLRDTPTDQQWDFPNGWAPLHWMAIIGLRRYGHHTLADHFRQTVERVHATTGRLMEKYNVVDTTLDAGGGEYPNQDGFGWTNGVYAALERVAG